MSITSTKKYKQGRPENGGHSLFRYWLVMKDGETKKWGICRDPKRKANETNELNAFKAYFDKTLNQNNDVGCCRLFENLAGGKGLVYLQWTSKNPLWHDPLTYKNETKVIDKKPRSKIIGYLRFNNEGMIHRRDNNIQPWQTAYIYSQDENPHGQFNWYWSMETLLMQLKQKYNNAHLFVINFYEQLSEGKDSRLVAKIQGNSFDFVDKDFEKKYNDDRTKYIKLNNQ